MITAANRAHDSLEPLANADPTRTARPPDALDEPRQIGGYRILETLGSGGMGVVYRGEQSGPVRREVAIKVIKLGMDTREVVARFETERQALAVMDHPNIAQVYDAGATAAGRPYFVMELVKGIPLNRYCDQQRQTIPERLELFVAICRAVQHAHQKGVIHRDLKHSNILVALHGGSAVPKIIDFGVAKATGMRLTEKTLFTSSGQMIGTPEYMSPEQAELSSLDIDTRTDIYSLGVILYELLAGQLPFPSKRLRGSTFSEMQRIIREETPPRPSTCYAKRGDAAVRSATNRGSDPSTLRRKLHGDLDWIVMKALEKDRRRRYETANALARDVEQFMQHRPIEARPPSAAYRMGKFVRRYRIRVALAGALLLAVLVGAAGTFVGFVRARDAERHALAEERRARNALGFFTETLMEGDPERAQGADVTVLEAVDRAASRLDTAIEEDPIVEAELRKTIGEIYFGHGRYETARAHTGRAVELFRDALGDEARKTIQSMNQLAMIAIDEGDYVFAESRLSELLEVLERSRGRDHPSTLTVMNNLGAVYYELDRLESASSIFERVLDGRRKLHGENDSRTLATLGNLGQIYMAQGEAEKAEPVYRRALTIRRQELGDRHPKTLVALFNLGDALHRLGRVSEAEPVVREAYEGLRTVNGPKHKHTVVASKALAELWVAAGRHADAEPIAREAYEGWVELVGPAADEPRELARTLSTIYELTGRPDDAAAWRERAL